MTKSLIEQKKNELLSFINKPVYGICSGKIIQGILIEVKETQYRLSAVIDHTKDPVSWGENSYTITENFMDKSDGFGSLIHFSPITEEA